MRRGFHPVAQQGADAVYGLQHGGRPAAGIDGAINPGIAVISGDHPLIGKIGAGDFADHVPHGALGVVHLHSQVNLDQVLTAHVVAEGQGSLPLPGGDRAAQVFQDRLRIVIGKRHGGDGGQAAHL